MKKRAIGVFDSGRGGLSAVRSLRELMPTEDICYLGDCKRMPYGGREEAELIELSTRLANFLAAKDVKCLLIACNTIDTTASEHLRTLHEIPIFGVVSAASKLAVRATENKTVGVISTVATARMRAYERGIENEDETVRAIGVGCPTLAHLAQLGKTSIEDSDLREDIEQSLADIIKNGADTLILGCTHYSLIEEAINTYTGGSMRLIDSGAAGAAELAAYFESRPTERAQGSDKGKLRFFTTGDVTSFKEAAEQMLGDVSDCEFEHVADLR